MLSVTSPSAPYLASATVRSSPGDEPGDALQEAQQAAASTPAGQRMQLNAQILQASMDLSLRSGEQSQALLYRAAIEQINAELESTLGPNAIQNAMQQDNSAEATAGRILAQSTAFFGAYAAQNPGQDGETLVRNFVSLVRGGFERGYAEAHQILSGLGVMGEGSSIAGDIAQTYRLVQQGYDDFLHQQLAALRGTPATAEG